MMDKVQKPSDPERRSCLLAANIENRGQAYQIMTLPRTMIRMVLQIQVF
jgi:hypothetical protein